MGSLEAAEGHIDDGALVCPQRRLPGDGWCVRGITHIDSCTWRQHSADRKHPPTRCSRRAGRLPCIPSCRDSNARTGNGPNSAPTLPQQRLSSRPSRHRYSLRMTTAGATRAATHAGQAAMTFAISNAAGTTAAIATVETTAGYTDPMLGVTRFEAHRPHATPTGSPTSNATRETDVACQATTSAT